MPPRRARNSPTSNDPRHVELYDSSTRTRNIKQHIRDNSNPLNNMYVSNYCDTTCRKTRICIVTFVQNIRNTRHEYRSTLTRVAYSAMPLLLLLLVPPPPLGRALPITKDARNNALRSTFTVTKNDARTISLLTEFSSPRSRNFTPTDES